MFMVMITKINHTYTRSAAEAERQQDKWSDCFACRGNLFTQEDMD